MKTYCFLLGIALSSFMFAQTDPIDIEFNEATPLWSHALKDTSFLPLQGQPNWTTYSSLNLVSIEENSGYLYAISCSNEVTGIIPDDYGFILEKLELETGEQVWSHHNTMSIDGVQDFYRSINFRDNGNIELVGAGLRRNSGQ